MLTPSQAAVYRRLTIGDEALLASLFASPDAFSDVIDQRTACLVRVAAVIIADPALPAYQLEVRDALDAGASPELITAVLLAVTRVAGSAAVMSAAPKLALALGYDVEAGLQDGDARDEDP
jgi:alkylhydroperoxidase/carboxymuconolactone decarboxylase family protein YurZ